MCSLALTSFPKYLRFNAFSSRRSLYARTKLVYVRAILAIHRWRSHSTHTYKYTQIHFRHGRLKACHIKRMGWPRAICASAFAVDFFSFHFSGTLNFLKYLRSRESNAGWRSAHASNEQTECLQRCNVLYMAWILEINKRTPIKIYGEPHTSNFIIYNSITAIVGIVSAVRSLCMPISGFIYSRPPQHFMFLFILLPFICHH